MFRQIDPMIAVSPQIDIEHVAQAAIMGVRLIINNRPDGESPDEAQGAEIEAAAQAAGLGYIAIPVTHAGFSGPQIDAMIDAMTNARGPVLAYCRSGTRSTLLWALARAKMGDDKTDLAAKAAGAGYDLSPIEPLLDMLAAQR